MDNERGEPPAAAASVAATGGAALDLAFPGPPAAQPDAWRVTVRGARATLEDKRVFAQEPDPSKRWDLSLYELLTQPPAPLADDPARRALVYRALARVAGLREHTFYDEVANGLLRVHARSAQRTLAWAFTRGADRWSGSLGFDALAAGATPDELGPHVRVFRALATLVDVLEAPPWRAPELGPHAFRCSPYFSGTYELPHRTQFVGLRAEPPQVFYVAGPSDGRAFDYEGTQGYEPLRALLERPAPPLPWSASTALDERLRAELRAWIAAREDPAWRAWLEPAPRG